MYSWLAALLTAPTLGAAALSMLHWSNAALSASGGGCGRSGASLPAALLTAVMSIFHWLNAASLASDGGCGSWMRLGGAFTFVQVALNAASSVLRSATSPFMNSWMRAMHASAGGDGLPGQIVVRAPSDISAAGFAGMAGAVVEPDVVVDDMAGLAGSAPGAAANENDQSCRNDHPRVDSTSCDVSSGCGHSQYGITSTAVVVPGTNSPCTIPVARLAAAPVAVEGRSMSTGAPPTRARAGDDGVFKVSRSGTRFSSPGGALAQSVMAGSTQSARATLAKASAVPHATDAAATRPHAGAVI